MSRAKMVVNLMASRAVRQLFLDRRREVLADIRQVGAASVMEQSKGNEERIKVFTLRKKNWIESLNGE